MDAPSLRAKQAPLKAHYRASPASALLTLSATGSLSSTSIACSLASGPAVAAATAKIAGLHPAAGGPDPAVSGEVCSGDMLLEALVACAGVTLKAVATAMEVPVKGGTVTAEGDLDFRGTMGVDKTAAVGFQQVRVRFELETEAGVGEETLRKLVELTERYCVVLQTLRMGPAVSVQCERMGGGVG